MSYRFTVVTGFLYAEDPAVVAAALEEQLGAEAVITPAGSCAYVSGYFRSTSRNDAEEWFENADIGVGFAVVTEWGEVWHKAPAVPSPEPDTRPLPATP